MKIYYASSIRGVHSKDKSFYDQKIVEHLLRFGVVLGGSIVNGEFNPFGDFNLSEKSIHDREMEWIIDSDAVIAEVTNPSLGVGYIIGRAVEHNKKILCLYRHSQNKLSTMILGSKNIKLVEYKNPDELFGIINEFVGKLKIKLDKTRTISDVNKSAFHDLITGKIN